MDYNKIINDNGFYLYKDDSFHTIYLQIGFLREKGNFEDAVFDLLCRYLVKTNKNYKTQYELNKKENDLYGMDFCVTTINIGSKSLLFFCADLVSPSVIHDDYSKEAFKYIHEMIFEPDFTNEKVFNNVKEIYYTYLLNCLSQPTIVARNMFSRLTFGCEHEKYKYATDPEYIKNMLDSITLKDLEEIYNKTVRKENFMRGLAFGNITDEEFKSLRETFDLQRTNPETDYSVRYNFENYNIEVSSDTANESLIFVTYDIDDMDPATATLINEFFNGSSDLCLDILREKYGLVYIAGVTVSYIGKYIVVSAQIDKENKEKFVEAVDEMMHMIQDKEKLQDLIERAAESIDNEYELLSENRDEMIAKIDDYVSGIFNGFDDTKFAKEVYGVKVEDVLKYTKTLRRRNIFMYRGDCDE